MYKCAECGGEITLKDSVEGRLMTINVSGHAKPAHRECPIVPLSSTEKAECR